MDVEGLLMVDLGKNEVGGTWYGLYMFFPQASFRIFLPYSFA